MEKLSGIKDEFQAGRFLFGIMVLFLASSFALSLLPLEWFEFFYAFLSLEALKLAGLSGHIELGEPVLIYLSAFTVPIGISYLCTGLLELALVWASVASSFGIEARKRAIGIAAGTAAIVVLNTARITASVLIIRFFGLDAGEFSHDILFRLFLVVTIAGFYYAWFAWATREKKSEKFGKKKNG